MRSCTHVIQRAGEQKMSRRKKLIPAYLQETQLRTAQIDNFLNKKRLWWLNYLVENGNILVDVASYSSKDYFSQTFQSNFFSELKYTKVFPLS